MIVVDSAVLADLVFGTPDLKASAEKLAELDPEWASLSLVHFELGNVAWKYLCFGKLTFDEANLRRQKALAILSEIVPLSNATSVFETAYKYRISFYDAGYVWLAKSRGLKLFSRDGKLQTKVSDIVQPMPTV